MLANIGIPMLCVTLPTMVLAFLPICYIEARVLRRICAIEFRDAWHGAVAANTWSTLLGIPIAWFIFLAVEIGVDGGQARGLDTPLARLTAVTLQAPWLVPYGSQTSWMVPAASLALLVPFFLASVAVEYADLRRRWKALAGRLFAGAVWANAFSYSLLAGFYLVQYWIASRGDPLNFVYTPDELTLYSIDGRDEGSGNDLRSRGFGVPNAIGEFHGYPVLGQIEVVDPKKRRQMVRQLQEGIASKTPRATCFLPRHGLRIVANGQVIELVVCYQCNVFEETVDGTPVRAGPISSNSKEILDEALKTAGIPIAPGDE